MRCYEENNPHPSQTDTLQFGQGCSKLVTPGPRQGRARARLGTLGIQAGSEHQQLKFPCQVGDAVSSAGSWRWQCSTQVHRSCRASPGTGCRRRRSGSAVFSHIPQRKELCTVLVPIHTHIFLKGRTEVWSS